MRNKPFFLGIILLAAASLSADEQEKPYRSLVENSPFLTPEFKARLGKHDTTSLIFIGYTRIGETWFFALLDKKSGKSHWLKINAEQDGIKIESFDEQEQRIHLSVAGIAHDLKLVKE